MELLRSGIKTVLGGPLESNQGPTVAETVEKLVERVITSTQLDDRRDACRGLRGLSKKFRLEVGAKAMDAFLQVLQYDRADNEIIGYVLEAICNVISGVSEDDDLEVEQKQSDENFGLEFTEIFIKKSDNVAMLLNLMEEYDFKVRWPVVKLLTAILYHKPKEVQDCILVSPMGVSRLMDLLSDTREIIRNDTLLLLGHLTKGNANIQKIVAFENAFDKILSIIRDEGYSDGGVIVEDCLLVLQTLLKNNSSNQTFFKEGSYIQHLAPFFQVHDSSERGWATQKITNVHMMLQVLRVLVSPNNPLQVTLSSQNSMYQCGLLEQLCNILMAVGIPADILTETINTVAEILRGNHVNQEYFSKLTAPTTPPQPAMVILLMSMVNEKQPFTLRCAVLYCFQCYVYKNETCQAQIVQTLLPATTESTDVTVGQILCRGLFNTDVISNWLAAVALSHVLVDSPAQKEQLLRVQLATGLGNPPVTLITQLSLMLQQAVKPQARLGIVMLLCNWLANCPNAVFHFLSISSNIPFLTSQVGLAEHDEKEDMVQGICAFLLGICIEFSDDSQQCDHNMSKEDLCQLVAKRIRLEIFLSKLTYVSKNEFYSRASQNPYITFKQPSDVLFDYEFCRLFKSLEGTIIKAVQPKTAVLNGPETNMSPDQQEHIKQYKDFIREQDTKIQTLSAKLSEVSTQYESTKTELDDMTGTVQQLRDQIALLKAQKSVSSSNLNTQLKDEFEKSKSDLQQQESEIAEKLQMKNHLDSEINVLTVKLSELKTEYNTANAPQGDTALPQQNDIAMAFQTDADLMKELEKLKADCEVQRQELVAKDHAILQLTVASQQNEMQSGPVENNISEEIISSLKAEIDSLKKSAGDSKYDKLLKDKEVVEATLSAVKKEQEDMLILLTDQGDKISQYRERLKELGETVEEDDDDADGYDLDDEDLKVEFLE